MEMTTRRVDYTETPPTTTTYTMSIYEWYDTGQNETECTEDWFTHIIGGGMIR